MKYRVLSYTHITPIFWAQTDLGPKFWDRIGLIKPLESKCSFSAYSWFSFGWSLAAKLPPQLNYGSTDILERSAYFLEALASTLKGPYLRYRQTQPTKNFSHNLSQSVPYYPSLKTSLFKVNSDKQCPKLKSCYSICIDFVIHQVRRTNS